MTVKLLVVAQTPPPYHGQAVLMRHILDGKYDGVSLHHVRMSFSKDMGDVGRVQPFKILQLIGLIVRIAIARVRFGTTVLLYPPAGPNAVPMVRDMAVLISTRWMFKKVIFHFTAAGLTEIYPRLGPVQKWLFRHAYYRPDLGIRTGVHSPDDARNLLATQEVIIPNAVPDSPAAQSIERRTERVTPTILFVATLRESKGVGVLLEAAHVLRQRQTKFRLKLVGGFESIDYQTAVERDIERLNLADVVEMPGVLLGHDFEQAYQSADLFCFPSFYESEAIPLVVVEAMRFGLPVVATRWRGLEDVVVDGDSGILVAIKDPIALADAISQLLQNRDVAIEMGRRGRRLYQDTYTVEMFHRRMADAFAMAADGVT